LLLFYFSVIPNPRSAGEALLQKTAAKEKPNDTSALLSALRLPNILRSFLDWMLEERPELAEALASVFLTHADNTKVAVLEAMAVCRRSYKLTREVESDLCMLALEDAHTEWVIEQEQPSALSVGALSKVQPQVGVPVLKLSTMVGPAADIVKKLVESNLLVPIIQAGQEENKFCFASLFVQDFASTCNLKVPLTSSFRILHAVDLHLRNAPSEEAAFASSGVRSDAEFQRTTVLSLTGARLTSYFQLPERASDGWDLVWACHCSVHPLAAPPFFQLTFGREWKTAFLSRGPGVQEGPIKLCQMAAEEYHAVADTAQEVLSSRSLVLDLSGKLSHLTEGQLRLVLACCQLAYVGAFSLDISSEDEVFLSPLVRESERRDSGVSGDSFQVRLKAGETQAHLILKLGNNDLSDVHVECLLEALPGLEVVSHVELSGCKMSQANLQRLLDRLNARCIRSLKLSRLTDLRGTSLLVPSFSHLRRLQSVDLASMGLQETHMPSLARQLAALPDLRDLTLDWNMGIDTMGLSLLSPALASCRSLRALRLAHCGLDASSAYVLGALLTSARQLQILSLSGCKLYDSGLQQLALTLRDFHFIGKVALRSDEPAAHDDSRFSPDGLNRFLPVLAHCPRMQHLEMSRSMLWKDGAQATDSLLAALAGSSMWDYLGLFQCQLGKTHFLQRLPNALPTQLRGLTDLVLQDNDLGDEHLIQLSEAVEAGVFRYLRSLNLHYNRFHSEGAQHLAAVLYCLPCLKELLLHDNAMSPEARLALCRSALRLPRMTSLNLSDQYSGDPADMERVAREVVGMVEEGGIEALQGEYIIDDRDCQLEQEFALSKMESLGFQQIPSHIASPWALLWASLQPPPPPLPPSADEMRQELVEAREHPVSAQPTTSEDGSGHRIRRRHPGSAPPPPPPPPGSKETKTGMDLPPPPPSPPPPPPPPVPQYRKVADQKDLVIVVDGVFEIRLEPEYI
jgi:Ran GTPase-activating protein (RanGAP) involved in mRNA processing and transport